MAAQIDYKVHGIVREIKETEAIIKYHEEGDDPMDVIMADQFRHRKHQLLKELLAELALSGVSFKEMKNFIQRLTKYLEKTDKAADASKELKSNLAEVETMLVS